MIGMILIGHAHIASEMKAAVEHILGKQAYMEALDVPSSRDTNQLQDELEAMVHRCNRGYGILIFADLFGGTPCNIALSYLKSGECEVISGFNLPALIKAASCRDNTHVALNQLAHQIIESGQQYICLASDFMTTPRQPVGKTNKVSASHA